MWIDEEQNCSKLVLDSREENGHAGMGQSPGQSNTKTRINVRQTGWSGEGQTEPTGRCSHPNSSTSNSPNGQQQQNCSIEKSETGLQTGQKKKKLCEMKTKQNEKITKLDKKKHTGEQQETQHTGRGQRERKHRYSREIKQWGETGERKRVEELIVKHKQPHMEKTETQRKKEEIRRKIKPWQSLQLILVWSILKEQPPRSVIKEHQTNTHCLNCTIKLT